MLNQRLMECGQINGMWPEEATHSSSKDPVKPMNWNNFLQLDWEF